MRNTPGWVGGSVEEGLESLRLALKNTTRCLRPGGIIAIMTDDFVRKERHEPLGLHVLGILIDQGFKLVTTIYNFNRNFISMSPIEMARSKRARLQVNAVKSIQVVKLGATEMTRQFNSDIC